MKKVVIIFISIIFILFIVINLNNYNLFLTLAGYQNATTIARGFDNSEREYRIIQVQKEGKSELLYLSKTSLGFWKAQYKGYTIGTKNEMNVLSWGKIVGEKTYNSSTDFSFESHIVYTGENAIKPIEISTKDLQQGIAININQYNNSYVIHLYYFGDNELIENFDLYNYLLQENMIE